MRRAVFFSVTGVLALWHGWFLVQGYLLVADDVFFLDTWLRGPAAVWETTRYMAEGHGRIGFYALMPLNMGAAALSVDLVWRIVFVSLYMAVAALMFVYAARLLGRPLAALAFLMWLSLHPLGFDHLSPNSYPLQNTLPAFVLIGLRLIALHRGEAGIGGIANRLGQVAMMLLTEFVAVLGFAMIAAEHLLRHPLSLRGWLRASLTDRATWREIATVALVLGPYTIYRLTHPSTYEGNHIDGLGQGTAIALTTFWHVVDPVVPVRFSVQDWFAAPIGVRVASLLAGALMACAVWQLLGRLRAERPVRLGPVLGFLVFAMVLVTLPVTITTKQQAWCLQDGVCAYLDSRFSIYGVAVAAAVLALRAQAAVWRGGVALLAGLCCAAGGLHNWQVVRQMDPYTQVWQGAEALACAPDLWPARPRDMNRLINPQDRVHLIPADIQARFWHAYLQDAAGWSDCDAHPVLARAAARSYLPLVSPGASRPVASLFLEGGWSAPEPQGVWSDGPQARLRVWPQEVAPGRAPVLVLEGHMMLDAATPRQRLRISQEGRVVFERVIGMAETTGPFEVRLLPHDPDAPEVVLVLEFPDAAPPANSSDTRQLGLFLRQLGLR